MQRKSARAASESKRSHISWCPGSSKRDNRRFPHTAHTFALIPPENAKIFVDLSAESQLGQVPEQALRTDLVSGVRVVVKSRADIGIRYCSVREIRRNGSFQVIEETLARRGRLYQDGVEPSGYRRTQQTSCHQL